MRLIHIESEQILRLKMHVTAMFTPVPCAHARTIRNGAIGNDAING